MMVCQLVAMWVVARAVLMDAQMVAMLAEKMVECWVCKLAGTMVALMVGKKVDAKVVRLAYLLVGWKVYMLVAW